MSPTLSDRPARGHLAERPRKRRQDGEQSRRTILRAAARLATLGGLEGLSIGRLAGEIGMSKSGLYAHFASKEALQLATLGEARKIFITEVIAPAMQAPAGGPRLLALADAFLSYVERRVFPGGCFFSIVAAEFAARGGSVKERVAAYQRQWMKVLQATAADAAGSGHLTGSTDPVQVAFEVNAVLVAANTSFLLHGDARVLARARQAIAGHL